MLKFSVRTHAIADGSQAGFDEDYTGFFGTFDWKEDDEDRNASQRFLETGADDRFIGYGGEDDFLLRWDEDRVDGGAVADRFIFDKRHGGEDVRHRIFDLNLAVGDQASIRRITDQNQIIDRQEELDAMVDAGAAHIMSTNGNAMHVFFSRFDDWGSSSSHDGEGRADRSARRVRS